MSLNVVLPVLLIALLVLLQAILDLVHSALLAQHLIHALTSASIGASVLHLLVLVAGPLYLYLVLPVTLLSSATFLGLLAPFLGLSPSIHPTLFLLSTLSSFPLIVHLLIQPKPLPLPTPLPSSFQPHLGTFADYKSSILPHHTTTTSWFSQSDADLQSLGGAHTTANALFVQVPALVLAAQLCSVLASAFEIPAAVLADRMHSMTAPGLVSAFQIMQGLFTLFCLVLVLVAYYRYCLTTLDTKPAVTTTTTRPRTSLSRSMKLALAPTPPPTPASQGSHGTHIRLVLPQKPREIYTTTTTTTTFSESLTSLHLPYPTGVPRSAPVHTYTQDAYTHQAKTHQAKTRHENLKHGRHDRQAFSASKENESFVAPLPRRTPLRVCTTALPLPSLPAPSLPLPLPKPSSASARETEHADADDDSVPGPTPTPTSTTSTSGCLPVFKFPVDAGSRRGSVESKCRGSVASKSEYSHREGAGTPVTDEGERAGAGAYTERVDQGVDLGAYTHRDGRASDGADVYADGLSNKPERTWVVGRPPTPGVYPDGCGRGRGLVDALPENESTNANTNTKRKHEYSTNSTNSASTAGAAHPYPYPSLSLSLRAPYPHTHTHTHTSTYYPRPPTATNRLEDPSPPEHEHDFTDLRDPFAPLARTRGQAHLVSGYDYAQPYILRASLPNPPSGSPASLDGPGRGCAFDVRYALDSDARGQGHPQEHPQQYVHPTRMSAWGRLQFPVKMPSSPSLRTGTGTGYGSSVPVSAGLGSGVGSGALGAPASISTPTRRRAKKRGKRRVGERERVLEDVDGDVEDSALLTQRLLRRLQRQGAGVGVERSWSFN